MTRWLDEHPDATYQQSADAVYLLARHGDSASEIYTRIRAALDAFTRAGEDTDVRAVDAVLRWNYGEVRPCEFNVAFARAAALADQSPDPQLAALIALAAVVRCPRYICALDTTRSPPTAAGSTDPGAASSPSHPSYDPSSPLSTSSSADPPRTARVAVLPGSAHGRMSQQSIRRALAELDAPASLWRDPPGTAIGEGANADGRMLLHTLTAWTLWLRREPQDP